VIGITFRSIDFFPARRCSPRSAANERPRPEVHSTGASGVTGPQSQLKPRPPNRPIRNCEVMSI
jgi:hypothetical protein